jgi:hypothetical protein
VYNGIVRVVEEDRPEKTQKFEALFWIRIRQIRNHMASRIGIRFPND